MDDGDTIAEAQRMLLRSVPVERSRDSETTPRSSIGLPTDGVRIYSSSSRQTSWASLFSFFTTFDAVITPSVVGQERLRTPRRSARTLLNSHQAPTPRQIAASDVTMCKKDTRERCAGPADPIHSGCIH